MIYICKIVLKTYVNLQLFAMNLQMCSQKYPIL